MQARAARHGVTKRDTTGRGELSEFEIITALLRSGRTVLRPVSARLRYDLVIDNRDGTFDRVQCKTGVLRRGAIVFRVANADGRRPSGVPYHGQIEAFGVFCEETQKAYLVPMSAVAGTRSSARLRVVDAKNGQAKRICGAVGFAIRPASSPGTAGSTR
jgi:PD-(D/E)XK endonuclease